MSNRFVACSLILNLDKTNIIEFVTNNSPQSAFVIVCKENYMEETVNKKFLALQIVTK